MKKYNKKMVVLFYFVLIFIYVLLSLVDMPHNNLEKCFRFYDMFSFKKKDRYYIKEDEYYYIWDGKHFYNVEKKNNKYFLSGRVSSSTSKIDSKENYIYIEKTRTKHYYIIVKTTNEDDNEIFINGIKMEPLKNIKNDELSNNIFGYIDPDNNREYKIIINGDEFVVENDIEIYNKWYL